MGIKKYIEGKVLDLMFGQMAECTHPSVFNDPLAEKTEWMPLQRGGANFQTHKLVTVQRDRMEFRASSGMILFSILFVLVGVGVSIGIFLSQEQAFPLILLGLVFMGAGGVMFYFSTSPVVLDKRKGFFWKGRKVPYESGNWREREDCARLGEVYALQLIAELVSGDKQNYYTYEINLVLKDGSRINVVDHGKKSKIQEDAKALAEFLGKPLWDASEMKIIDKKTLQEICKRAKEHPELLDEQTKRKLEELKKKFKMKY
ncbi:MAG: hypothetical protein Q3M30_09040 [Candidatus Electrothrix sp. Rat3]|nr:hypothetical protein [Candidatus Electrothrix rattekaaiensis]